MFLPFLTQSLISDLQIAMNAGVRAIFGLCRYGFENITSLRKSLEIPSVIEIKEYVCLKGAWDRRDWFKNNSQPIRRQEVNTNGVFLWQIPEDGQVKHSQQY